MVMVWRQSDSSGGEWCVPAEMTVGLGDCVSGWVDMCDDSRSRWTHSVQRRRYELMQRTKITPVCVVQLSQLTRNSAHFGKVCNFGIPLRCCLGPCGAERVEHEG